MTRFYNLQRHFQLVIMTFDILNIIGPQTLVQLVKTNCASHTSPFKSSNDTCSLCWFVNSNGSML